MKILITADVRKAFRRGVKARIYRSTLRVLPRAAHAISQSAKALIKRPLKKQLRDERGRFRKSDIYLRSLPGQPPRSPTGLLRKSIGCEYETEYGTDQIARIGPRYSLFANVGKAHEHGVRFRGRNYPKRPFMAPALMKNLHRLPKFWQNSVR